MSKRNLVTLLVAFFLCHFQMTVGNPITKNMNSGGYERSYQLYEPASLDETTGVMLCLHGLGGSSSNFFDLGIKSIADELNMIIVAPQALPEKDENTLTEMNKLPESLRASIPLTAVWGAGLYIDATLKLGMFTQTLKAELNAGIDDVTFLKAVLTEVTNQYSGINKKRIYIFGISLGGFMSYQYAASHSDELAALISVSGSMGTHIKNKTGAKPLTICDFHSVDDDVVPYAGTITMSGTPTIQASLCDNKEDVIKFWNQLNHPTACTPETYSFPDANGKKVTKYTYSRPGEKDVIHYKINGTNHTYYFAKSAGDAMDYNDELVAFIRANDAKALGIENLYAEKMHIYPNPAHDIINLPIQTGKIVIYDLVGKIALSGNIDNSTFNVSSLPKGTYVVKLLTEGTVHAVKLQVE